MTRSAVVGAIDEAIAEAERRFLVQEFVAARRLLDRALTQKPTHLRALRLRARVHSRGLQDFDRARADLEAILAAHPDDAEALSALGELHLQIGGAADAETFARRSLETKPRQAEAYALLVKIDPMLVDGDAFALMNDLAQDGGLAPRARRALLNGIARILEKNGEIDPAFDAYAAANALEERAFDPEPTRKLIAAMRRGLDAAFFADRRGHGLRSERPVFMIGMPRSGSTLLEEVLARHPRIDGVGETNALLQVERTLNARLGEALPKLDRFERMAKITKPASKEAATAYLKLVDIHIKNRSATRIIDKGLANFLRVPLVQLLFPNAGVLHAFRHPLDTCWSCYKQDFDATPFAADLTHVAQFFACYQELMELWLTHLEDRVIHVCHEDFVTDFAEVTPRLLSALNLPWDEACRTPRKDRLVYTASAGQVHNPLSTGGFGAWRKFEHRLGPLIEALGGLTEIERGYERFRALSV